MAYVKGNGHTHYGPGTSMVQFVPRGFQGMGDCESLEGLKTCCDSCAHGGSCGRGLSGCGCNKGLMGLGLFESGMDFSGWTWQDWMVVGLGGYVLTSVFFTGRRAVRQVREGVSKRVRRTRKRIGAKIAG